MRVYWFTGPEERGVEDGTIWTFDIQIEVNNCLFFVPNSGASFSGGRPRSSELHLLWAWFKTEHRTERSRPVSCERTCPLQNKEGVSLTLSHYKQGWDSTMSTKRKYGIRSVERYFLIPCYP